MQKQDIFRDWKTVQDENKTLRELQEKENVVFCKSCSGKGYVNKNFRNNDGSVSLIKDQNCDVCKGIGVVAEKITS